MGRVSQKDILAHYFGVTSLPVLMKSPLRKDEHPSFRFYTYDGDKILYKDFATGESGDILSLMQKMYNISFGQLMRKIGREVSFHHVTVKCSADGNGSYTRKPSDIRVTVRKWKDYDIAYWASYGVSPEMLRMAEVYPISHKIVYKDGNRYVFPAEKHAYVFVERKEGNITFKIYQPFSKAWKWTTNNNASVVGLWTKLPESGDILCICSSLKDALCIWGNVGIPAIYVQSETTNMSDTAQKVLRSRFKRICVCFDNDEPGIRDADKFSRQTGFENIRLPYFNGGKDISDAYKALGKEKFLKMIKPLFYGEQESQERDRS